MSRHGTRGGILFALWFFYLVNYLDRAAISIAGPAIMFSLAMQPSDFGMILSSFGVGYFLAQIPGGLLADRWGARLVLVVSPLFWALFTGMTGLVSTLAGFVAVRFCFGLAEGVSQGPTYRAIGESFDSRQRARALAIVVSAATVAPAIAGPIVGALLAWSGWRPMFLLLVLPALAAAALSYVLLPRGIAAEPIAASAGERSEARLEAMLRQPELWLLSASQFGYNFVTWGYSGWLPSYLAMARGIDLKSIGLLSGIPYAFGFFGLLAGGVLGSSLFHRHRPHLVASCYVVAGLCLIAAYRADSVVLSIAGLSGTAFFLYAGYGPKGAVMLDLAPERYRAAYVGVVSTVGQSAAVLAPAAIGFLVSASGSFATGFSLMIAALFIAAASLLLLIPRLTATPLARPNLGHPAP